mgnify:CR=1 FL=1
MGEVSRKSAEEARKSWVSLVIVKYDHGERQWRSLLKSCVLVYIIAVNVGSGVDITENKRGVGSQWRSLKSWVLVEVNSGHGGDGMNIEKNRM